MAYRSSVPHSNGQRKNLVRSSIASIAAVIAMVAAGATFTAPVAAAASATYHRPDGVNYTYHPGDPAAGATATGCASDCPDPMYIPDSLQIGSEMYPVVAIGLRAFTNESISRVEIGDNVTEIFQLAFSDANLEELTLGNGVATIRNSAFAHNNLNSLELPQSVTDIGVSAFAHNKLSSVTIPHSLAKIPTYAFLYNDLVSVNFLGSVTEIGKLAFGHNPDLDSVTFTGPAPAVIDAIATGTYGSISSFDTSSGSLVLSYPWRYGTAQVAGGYTTPTWEGYDTQPIATVTFDANGHGAAPGSAQVDVGSKAHQPTDLSAAGWKFTGWYTDGAANDKFSFTTPVAGDMTLYAGWEKVEAPGAPGAGGTPSTGGTPTVCSPFPDVDSSNLHCNNIAWLKDQSVTKPADGMYHPADPVTRGSMTAFLFRLTHPGQSSPACSNDAFPDVDSSNVFCGYITWAADNGVAKGYPDGTFRSSNGVTRGAMAAFLKRIATDDPTPQCHSKPFADVSTTEVFCGVITWMKHEKLTYGVGDGTDYGTTQIVNRQSMASFLHRIDNYRH